MKRLKVFTVLGTRPEIIRLSRVLVALDKACDHTIVHTGQNYDYELNEIFFNDLGIRKPDYFLEAAGSSGAETIGKIIIRFDELLSNNQPDALLVLGDTNSCLSVIPAKRRKIPIFHMEAGNRCFDLRVPEEINRRIVDHTSDINLTYSAIAREYLLREGLSPDQVIKTGSPMYEVLQYYMSGIKSSGILGQLNLKSKEYFLVSAHREENIDSEQNFNSLVDTLNAIANIYNLPVIVSTHPRTQKKIDQLKIDFHRNVRLLKPLGFMDYNKLQIESKVVLSDSGTITEESSILKFAALNIREAHERPEGMEEAAVMMVGLKKDRILQAIALLDQEGEEFLKQSKLVEDYSMPNVSEKVVRIIFSYTDYVKRIVWKQY
ncbi:non-hydrolyzing UDP-N-acetylglucosamine 2-epimerase [Leptospira brenneri]|uniref:UDP-N-acetylglucosamine 2-epimerase (Non-hydrolyzing) n=1 Tax=Leptospira brenneri TaxID=2023182 RepID=A0A2M9Y274_9LEPT|nr:UDP-N-acetylglucosamine 2-epimerase (non-hydrolyzing) [Leptospira brenneri]PJZ45496.1 UDP-N-acetylglucosamine 2-epimerase (non-hydrolyzing) [Leptospira brenneri]TGK91988.1 UDP-N-acetylglucosamine 2-epimerase (non-hydrolyzing) [Leptospira brenneri]